VALLKSLLSDSFTFFNFPFLKSEIELSIAFRFLFIGGKEAETGGGGGGAAAGGGGGGAAEGGGGAAEGGGPDDKEVFSFFSFCPPDVLVGGGGAAVGGNGPSPVDDVDDIADPPFGGVGACGLDAALFLKFATSDC